MDCSASERGAETLYLHVDVGDIYDMNRPFHIRWVNYLLNVLPSGTINDTAIFSAGLHQLMYGYNPKTSVDLVLSMLCHLAEFLSREACDARTCPNSAATF
jgi:hypothetical protein